MRKLFYVLFIFLAVEISLAENTWDTGFRLNHGSTVDVIVGSASGPCSRLTNSNLQYDFFVPTWTIEEWNLFLIAAPQLGISFASCLAECTMQELQTVSTHHAEDAYTFTIGSDTYLAIALVDTGRTEIYRWNGNAFQLIQTLITGWTASVEPFDISANQYLAIAKYYDAGTGYETNSHIYRWNGNSFELLQNIPTRGAYDWKFFTIGSNHYLAVANWGNGATNVYDSRIYRWAGSSFQLLQSIGTDGAVEWEFFSIGTDNYLALLQGKGATTSIFRWASGQFNLIQTVTSYATDLEPMLIGSTQYLGLSKWMQASHFSYHANSEIYRWNGNSFLLDTILPTVGAFSWEFYNISGTPFLAVVSHSSDTTGYNTPSIIYRHDGSAFQNCQSIPTYGAWRWHAFTIGTKPYLALVSYAFDFPVGTWSTKIYGQN